jgi:DNA anti-recombination protein RmuC
MEKTLKIRAYTQPGKGNASHSNSARADVAALELEQKNTQLEEERNKSLELLKSLTQLRESLKQEQTKTAELESKLAQLETKIEKLATLEESQINKRDARIEEEKKHSLELMRTIEKLKESIKQEQARSLESADRDVQLEAKQNEISELEVKIKALNGVISRIASLAEATMNISGK